MSAEPSDGLGRDVGAPTSFHLSISGPKLSRPRTLELHHPFAVIGRAEMADIHLPDSQVSYRHAYLQFLDGGLFYIDLGSKTGIFREDERRTSGRWKPNQPLRIGSYTVALLPAEHGESLKGCHERQRFDPLALLDTPHAFSNFVLEFHNALMAETTHSIERRITLIGQHASCPIRLDSERVSRVHCSLVLTPAGLWVIDLLGKGGTLVREKRDRYSALTDASEFTIGDFRIGVYRQGYRR